MTNATVVSGKKVVMIGPSKIRPALCLDLDGTVRYSTSGDFINKPEDVALFDGVESKIWEYRDKGFLICGITNQGGVAFGIKTPLDNEAELDAMTALFDRNPFHIIIACYNHERGLVEPYRHRSLLRKPDTGILALCELDAFENGVIIDWNESIFVGDGPEDEQCARNARIKFQWADEFFGRDDLDIPRCAYCKTFIGGTHGMLGLGVSAHGLEFCSDGCAENFGT